jgi:radical SAM superfamily enzyme YgiQ (UPF0313 family)
MEEGIKKEYVADVRTDTIVKHPEVLTNAAKAGLHVAIIGLEATTDSELDKYNKKNSIENTVRAMEILNDEGVWISGNYIIDPDFDDEAFERVGAFVENHPIFFSGFTILTPFPGTEQYEILKDKIMIDNFDYYNLVNAVVKTRLPEKRFYDRINELYQIGRKSTQKFFETYKNAKEYTHVKT